MPRAAITNRQIDLNTDNGSVLWSLVQGEQFEFMLTLKYLNDVTGMVFRAVLVEGLNLVYTSSDEEVIPPTTVRPSGAQDILTVRVPTYVTWVDSSVYAVGDIVFNGTSYYKCLLPGTTETLVTDISAWEPYTHNKIYLRFPSTLSLNYAVQPLPEIPVYGFFELAVTGTEAFPIIKKSIRGLVAFFFSPTALVP